MLSPSDKRSCWRIHIWDHDPYTGESREALLPGILAALLAESQGTQLFAKSSGSLVNHAHVGSPMVPGGSSTGLRSLPIPPPTANRNVYPGLLLLLPNELH